MKKRLVLILVIFMTFSCIEEKEISSFNTENWSKRAAKISAKDSLEFGKSYLATYSEIYSLTEHKTHGLTVMVSMRNISDIDTIYVLKAEYFDTHGKSVRKYFDTPIYLAPLETAEIIIDEIDTSGGTGSNFIFDWKIPKNCPEPLFDGVMSSTMGKQGLSFTTEGKRIK
ncbi:DUF3124 domain-containing protein [Lacinutrix sp. C3R15]|uniref:DUF3124 domain-containing protein n=1 Tax=Flavobacteriaceae TaxID=49546 RepID=UPI001C08EA8C|nr:MULTISPECIES: DUF3124 domain-containing protein [Flavobacteriaceae]MBU2938666.1 DUF3124 domain-containing protein [Lacinutrix sp. C3R15]MDO6621980.1 DUF3124 domain-containing protein [Oceanihabitans sp. 1_MG-2023]